MGVGRQPGQRGRHRQSRCLLPGSATAGARCPAHVDSGRHVVRAASAPATAAAQQQVSGNPQAAAGRLPRPSSPGQSPRPRFRGSWLKRGEGEGSMRCRGAVGTCRGQGKAAAQRSAAQHGAGQRSSSAPVVKLACSWSCRAGSRAAWAGLATIMPAGVSSPCGKSTSRAGTARMTGSGGHLDTEG